MDFFNIEYHFQESQILFSVRGKLTKTETIELISILVERTVDYPVKEISLDFYNATINTNLMFVYDIKEIFDFNVFSKDIKITLFPPKQQQQEDIDFFEFFKQVFNNSGYNLNIRELVG